MPSHQINFAVPRSDTIEFPSHLLAKGRYKLVVSADDSVEIEGNRDGLLYLAEVFARFALGGYQSGFHAHLPLDSEYGGPNVNNRPELTVTFVADRVGRP